MNLCTSGREETGMTGHVLKKNFLGQINADYLDNVDVNDIVRLILLGMKEDGRRYLSNQSRRRNFHIVNVEDQVSL